MPYDLFHVGVKVIFVRGDQILLLKRTDPDGQKFFDLPGGRLHKGEAPENAITREVAEELLDIKDWHINRLVFATSFRTSDPDKPATIYLLYSGTLNDKVITVSKEHDSYTWLPIQDVPKYSGQTLDGYRLGTQLQEAIKFL